MYKILSLFFLFTIGVYSKEPSLAILLNVNSNTTQQFNIGNYNFYCQPYGVVSLEKLYSNSTNGSICQKNIDMFYKKNPDLKYYSDTILHLKQRYHIDFKNGSCVLYAKGQLTLSEILIKKGLALVEPMFKDDEFISSFKKSELEAMLDKRGLWNSDIKKSCISEFIKR